MIEHISPQSFRELEAPWRELHTRVPGSNLFSTHAWLSRWLVSFGDSHEVLVDRDGDGLASAVVLRFDGSVAHHLEDHTYWPDILTPPGGGGRRRLLEHLHRKAMQRVVLLARDGIDQLEALALEADGLFEVVPKWVSSLHAVATRNPFEAYLLSRRGKVRSELKRKDKRFSSTVAEEDLLVYGPDQVEAAMEAVCAIEAASWKDEAETSIISSGAERRFYRDVLGLDAEGAKARTYVLTGDGAPRAFVIGVVHGGAYHALKTSYCAVDANLSPGQVLFYRVIARLCGEPGIDRLELLGRDARWKQELATETVALRTYELQRRSLRAVVAKVAERHVLPFVREAMQDRPALGEAASRARTTLAAARRFFGVRDDVSDDQP